MYTRFPSLIFKANLKQPKKIYIYIFLESNNAVDEKNIIMLNCYYYLLLKLNLKPQF